MSYDQGYWHTDSCAEKNLHEQYAGTHIAVYLKWCIEKGFLSKDILMSDADALASVRDGRMSTREYFEKHLDWKFGEMKKATHSQSGTTTGISKKYQSKFQARSLDQKAT